MSLSDHKTPSATDMIGLAMAVDKAQAYFMALALNHEEITLSFKNEQPFVTAFVGKGPDAKIGFGPSVAHAIGSAIYGDNFKPPETIIDEMIKGLKRDS